jgi:SMODS-associated and fused to various effectors sensor domain
MAAQKKIKNRPSIPEKVKLQLWCTSGGRCSFRGCNKELWFDNLTFSVGKFGELAHIIGAKEGGPRGNSNSDLLAQDPSNIMLLCQAHHDLVDENIQIYSVPILKKMKIDHEYRIKQVTSITENCQTEILIFKANIHNQPVDIDYSEAHRVIVDRGLYPASHDGKVIDRTNEDGDGKTEYWQYNKGKITDDVKELIYPKTNATQKTTHLSVFALGPIPFLILLGKCIGGTGINKIEIFHRDRVRQSWEWQIGVNPHTLPKYQVIRPKVLNKEHEPALILALSDYIQTDKYKDVLSEEQDVYIITLDGEIPNRAFCRHPSVVSDFIKIFHQLLNELQSVYGVKTTVHLLPAIPNSIAVHCGMALLPKKEMPILVYDFNKEFDGFRPIFQI